MQRSKPVEKFQVSGKLGKNIGERNEGKIDRDLRSHFVLSTIQLEKCQGCDDAVFWEKVQFSRKLRASVYAYTYYT